MKYFVSLLLMSCFLFSGLEGISPPKPITGTPFIFTPKFSTSSGSFTFEINVPSKWGIGEMSVTPDGSAHFELYPEKGGYGCVIETQFFAINEEAMDKLNKTRKKFENTKDLEDGFEAELSHAWFSCRVNEGTLIQTWYSLPKKNRLDKGLWKLLKNCIQASNIENLTHPEPESHGLINKTSNDWMFNHPTKKQSVFYKDFFSNCKQRENDSFSYLIKIDDIHANAAGYFFIEWDQSVETEEPYRDFANKILQEIKAISPNQVVDPIKIILKDGYAILPGDPYGIVVVSGNNFLFGFAVRKKIDVADIRPNALIENVRWTFPE